MVGRAVLHRLLRIERQTDMQLGIGLLAWAGELSNVTKRLSPALLLAGLQVESAARGSSRGGVNSAKGCALHRTPGQKQPHPQMAALNRTLWPALLLLADCSPTALRMYWPAALHSLTQRASPCASRRPSKRSPALREPANMMPVSFGCVAFDVPPHCCAARNHKSRSDAGHHLRRRTLLAR
jgi:hypothetical protein